MALIGLGTVTILGMILAVRSEQRLNKLIVVGMWVVMALFSTGVVL